MKKDRERDLAVQAGRLFACLEAHFVASPDNLAELTSETFGTFMEMLKSLPPDQELACLQGTVDRVTRVMGRWVPDLSAGTPLEPSLAVHAVSDLQLCIRGAVQTQTSMIASLSSDE